MPRLLLLLSALLLLAACATSGNGPQATGTVTGHVLAAPCTPVERFGQTPCPGLPVPGASITFTMGSQSATASTDASGAYSVSLPPGTWSATLAPHPPFGVQRTASVTVTAGATAVLDFHIDSGIR